MGIFKNITNAVGKAFSDTTKQVKRSAQDVAGVVDSKIGKVVLGAAVALGTGGIGIVGATAIGAAAGAAKRGGNIGTTLKGAATGAAAGVAGKIASAGAGKVTAILKGAATKAVTKAVETGVTPMKTAGTMPVIKSDATEEERSEAFKEALQPKDETDRVGRIKYGRAWVNSDEQRASVSGDVQTLPLVTTTAKAPSDNAGLIAVAVLSLAFFALQKGRVAA
jgi:hypothetical protein